MKVRVVWLRALWLWWVVLACGIDPGATAFGLGVNSSPDALPGGDPTRGGDTEGRMGEGDSGEHGTSVAAVTSNASGHETSRDPTGATTGEERSTTSGQSEGGGSTTAEVSLPSFSPCDPLAPACALNERCAPYLAEGTVAFHCAPLHASPNNRDAACTVDTTTYALADYVDSCNAGLTCLGFDGTPNVTGRCQPLCNSGCAAAEVCITSVANDLSVCARPCNPLVLGCASGFGCYPVAENFACLPTTSPGPFRAACTTPQACSPGMACFPGAYVFGCTADACCTPYCDMFFGASCPLGTDCLYWYDFGAAPPGLEDLGLCASF